MEGSTSETQGWKGQISFLPKTAHILTDLISNKQISLINSENIFGHLKMIIVFKILERLIAKILYCSF